MPTKQHNNLPKIPTKINKINLHELFQRFRPTNTLTTKKLLIKKYKNNIIFLRHKK